MESMIVETTRTNCPVVVLPAETETSLATINVAFHCDGDATSTEIAATDLMKM